MALQYGAELRDALLNYIVPTVGASAKLRMYDGTLPETCEADPKGILLVEFDLPKKWLGQAQDGLIAKAGTWRAQAGAAGTAKYWRIYDASGMVCHLQGDIGEGSYQIAFDNPSLKQNQTLNVTDFILDGGNF